MRRWQKVSYYEKQLSCICGGNVSRDKKKEEIKEETTTAADATETSEKVEESKQNEGQEEPREQTPRDLEKELAEAVQAAAENRDKLLRVAADFENFKKRMEREHATMMKYAGEYILREMLPVVDNLERAVEHGTNNEGSDAEKGFTALFEGVELTLKSLRNSLEKFEVKPVESIGQPFDPNQMEAMTMEASDTIPASHVITEFEKGYFYKDRLLRAAKVIVSSGKAES
jgi:molecular chaperone GrpE